MIINRYAKGGGLSPRIVVSVTTGATVTCSKGATTLTATSVDGKCSFDVNDYGVWTVSTDSDTKTVNVEYVQLYEVTLKYVSGTLNDNDWATIKDIADRSEGANYWSVGDTKQITINGKLSDGLTLSNYQTWVYIIGFDHNSSVEGTGIAFQGFKTAQTSGSDVALCDSGYDSGRSSGQWFQINNSNTNSGGWKSCNMRNITLPLVKSVLPSELTSVIKTMPIYTDNTGSYSSVASYVTATADDLYLLAEWEIFGAKTYANTAEQNYQQQYAYYVAGNSKIKYRHDSTTTAVRWWERSPIAASPATYFCCVYINGGANIAGASYSLGFAPAFKVGGFKYTPLEYIQSTGTQYIDTGVVINSTTYNKLEFEEDVLYPSLSGTYYLVNGASGSNVIYYYGLNNSNGAVVYGDGTADKTTSYTVSANERYTVVFSPATGKYTFGSNPSVSFTPVSMTGNSNFYVFAYNKGSTQDCHIERLYSLKIRMDGELIRDFIPAKDEVGNVGLYDKIGEKFYYNSGTGTFAIPGVR